MNTEKMTVHRALAELKTIDSRIEAQIMKADFCCANKHSNKKIKGDTIAAYEDAARAAYKSINTLINRRNALKKAVVLSNARTIVTIGGIDYTVAEAIEMKNHGIDNQRNLMDVMRHQFRSASNEIDRRNPEFLEMMFIALFQRTTEGIEIQIRSRKLRSRIPLKRNWRNCKIEYVYCII